MSNSRSGGSSSQIPYPYNTTLYVPVDCLSRTPSGRVYDPARGPVRPRERSSRSSHSRRSRTSRERSSRSQRAPAQGTQTQGTQTQGTQTFQLPPGELNLRVNNNFIANVRRVLGEDYVSLWSSLEEMVEHMQEDFNQTSGRVILNRDWTPEELEQAARLQAWQVPDVVVENILGWPNRSLTDQEKEQATYFLRDEVARLSG